MFDSPKTKFIKNIFNNEYNFQIFLTLIKEFWSKNSLPVIYDRQIKDYYNALKKEIRIMLKNFSSKYEIDYRNKEVTDILGEKFINSITQYANDFCSNFMSATPQHHVKLIRNILKNIEVQVLENSNFANNIKIKAEMISSDKIVNAKINNEHAANSNNSSEFIAG